MKAGWDINEIDAVAGSPNVLPVVPPALGAVLRHSCPFSSPQLSHGTALGTHREGETAFHGETGENNSLEPFVQGTCRSRACTCTSGAGRDLPLHEHSAFISAGLPKSDLFFSSGLVLSVQQGSKSFQKLSSDPAGLKWPSPLPRLQYS